jgi:ubiquinone/menaquinone biosynthesis C-methylase UbiE
MCSAVEGTFRHLPNHKLTSRSTLTLIIAISIQESHFVGLDVVPLQPDLQQIGVSNLGSRITWVQANFLEGLPFPNEEFDFV